MTADTLLSRLQGVRETGPSLWLAKCPAHDDRHPSLSLKLLDDGRWLIHDFSGCNTGDVLAAVGLHFSDLFPESLRNPNTTHGGFRRERKPFAASDALVLVTREAFIVKIAAEDIAAGKAISQEDVMRVSLAAERLWDACTVTGSWA